MMSTLGLDAADAAPPLLFVLAGLPPPASSDRDNLAIISPGGSDAIMIFSNNYKVCYAGDSFLAVNREV